MSACPPAGVMPRSRPACCDWHRYLAGFIRQSREQDDRRQWIEGVKRRLGLIEPCDDVSARLAQWEHDHLTVDDLPAALCAGGRELDTALTLELYDQHVSEIRAHPWMTPGEIWLYRAEPIPLSGLFRQVRCPGCFVMMYAGHFDPSCHYSFCSIAHPPMTPLNLGGLLSGF